MRALLSRRSITLLYKVGTQKEIPILYSKLPESIVKELLRCTAILDARYGAERDYLESGEYMLVAENSDDLIELKRTINYDTHPCEWVNRIGKDGKFISALYLMNNEYSIQVLIPTAITPNVILRELED